MNELKYLNEKQVLLNYPLSEGQLNYFLLHRNKNGLDACCVKIGKRIYFTRLKLDQWFEKGGPL